MTQQNLNTLSDHARKLGRADVNVADARAAVVSDLKAMGQETPEIKRAFLSGHVAGTLKMTGKGAMDRAAAILDKAGANTNKRADARRTQSQETAYGAARKAWQRVRDEAGIKPADKRGTKSKKADATSNAKGKAAKGKATGSEGKAPVDKTPAAASPRDAAAHLLAFANKNAAKMAGSEGKDVMRAIKAFAKAQLDDTSH